MKSLSDVVIIGTDWKFERCAAISTQVGNIVAHSDRRPIAINHNSQIIHYKDGTALYPTGITNDMLFIYGNDDPITLRMNQIFQTLVEIQRMDHFLHMMFTPDEQPRIFKTQSEILSYKQKSGQIVIEFGMSGIMSNFKEAIASKEAIDQYNRVVAIFIRILLRDALEKSKLIPSTVLDHTLATVELRNANLHKILGAIHEYMDDEFTHHLSKLPFTDHIVVLFVNDTNLESFLKQLVYGLHEAPLKLVSVMQLNDEHPDIKSSTDYGQALANSIIVKKHQEDVVLEKKNEEARLALEAQMLAEEEAIAASSKSKKSVAKKVPVEKPNSASAAAVPVYTGNSASATVKSASAAAVPVYTENSASATVKSASATPIQSGKKQSSKGSLTPLKGNTVTHSSIEAAYPTHTGNSSSSSVLASPAATEGPPAATEGPPAATEGPPAATEGPPYVEPISLVGKNAELQAACLQFIAWQQRYVDQEMRNYLFHHRIYVAPTEEIVKYQIVGSAAVTMFEHYMTKPFPFPSDIDVRILLSPRLSSSDHIYSFFFKTLEYTTRYFLEKIKLPVINYEGHVVDAVITYVDKRGKPRDPIPLSNDRPCQGIVLYPIGDGTKALIKIQGRRQIGLTRPNEYGLTYPIYDEIMDISTNTLGNNAGWDSMNKYAIFKGQDWLLRVRPLEQLREDVELMRKSPEFTTGHRVENRPKLERRIAKIDTITKILHPEPRKTRRHSRSLALRSSALRSSALRSRKRFRA